MKEKGKQLTLESIWAALFDVLKLLKNASSQIPNLKWKKLIATLTKILYTVVMTFVQIDIKNQWRTLFVLF